MYFLAPAQTYWISGAETPTKDDLLVIGKSGKGRLVFRPRPNAAWPGLRLRESVYLVKGARERTAAQKLYDSFSDAVLRLMPTRQLNAERDAATVRRLAWERWSAILVDPSERSTSPQERVEAQGALPELFRAASIVQALAGVGFSFLRTPEILRAVGVAIDLERDRERLLERLMSVFTRSEQFEDEAARAALLSQLNKLLA